ncbi:hypothetical protein C8R44DRAFT_895963 [Mycena epipterygia]|nr:hypothetical protein C8R44DRAFT_895963 [Mycena epipterygia]
MFLLITAQQNPAHLQHLPDAGDNPHLHCIRQIRTSDSRARRRAREPRKTTTIPRIAGRTASPSPWTTPRIAHTPVLRVLVYTSAATSNAGSLIIDVSTWNASRDSVPRRSDAKSPRSHAYTKYTPDVRFLSMLFIPHEPPQSTHLRAQRLPPYALLRPARCAIALRMRSATPHARVRPASPRSAAALLRTYNSTHLRSHFPQVRARRRHAQVQSLRSACAHAYTVCVPQPASRDASARP